MVRRAAVALVLLGGCGWKSDGLARLEELYPAPRAIVDAGSSGPIDIGNPQCSGYDGTWAVRLVQNGTIAPLGEPWKMTITDLFLAEGNGQSLQLRFCDQSVSIVTSGGQTDLGKAKVPAALQSALEARPVLLPIPATGAFSANDQVWLWGLQNLAQPLTDRLPTKDDYLGDPRVLDQDSDGKPGATLTILAPSGDRYMVRRAIWSFGVGKLTLDNQWLTGPLSSTIHESALGATNNLLLTPAPITSRPEGTVYQLRCVGKTYSCPALARDFVELFQGAPK